MCATQRTRVQMRNQVTKNMKSEYLQRTNRFFKLANGSTSNNRASRTSFECFQWELEISTTLQISFLDKKTERKNRFKPFFFTEPILYFFFDMK